MLVHKRVDVTGEWKLLHNKDLHNFWTTGRRNTSNQSKKCEIGGNIGHTGMGGRYEYSILAENLN